MRTLAAIGLIGLLLGCSGPSDNLVQHDRHAALKAFNNFPDSLFYGVYFYQEQAEAMGNLAQTGFVLIDSSGSYQYELFADSTLVILPGQPVISELKIILKSAAYLASAEELCARFRSRSSTFDESDTFRIYNYRWPALSFRLSVFIQPALIRLVFELETSK